MKIIRIWVVLLFLSMPAGADLLRAQTPDSSGFAGFLFQKGEYYRAITEYYRLLYLSEEREQRTALLKRIGLCYVDGGDYNGYISFFNTNRIHFHSDSSIIPEMQFYLGKCYYHLHQYQNAIRVLELSTVKPDHDIYDDTQFLLGLSYIRVFDWQTAVRKFNLTSQDHPGKKRMDAFSRSLTHFPDLPEKSPLCAGIMSAIVPGSGYFYCNRRETAIAAFLVNGLIFWTLRDAMINRQYGFASAVFFFGTGWYIGNIRGSVRAASEYNTDRRHRYIDYWLEREQFDEYMNK